MKIFFLNKERGGAALEYLIVSIFAVILSITILGYCSSIINKKLNEIFLKLGMEDMNIDFQLFDF